MDRNLELQKYVPLFVRCALAPAARHEVPRSFFYVSSNCACTVAPRDVEKLDKAKPSADNIKNINNILLLISHA